MELLAPVIEKLKKSKNNYDIEKITHAYNVAATAHKEQKRESGEPYIIHPLAVAEILSQFEPDTNTIIAALLHDTIEDTSYDYQFIKKEFGTEVAELVDGVTKLGKIPFSSKEEQQVENLRKMFFAMAKDIRVILIKLADRLHNVRTLSSVSPKKQLAKSLETMEVYAPLAHRLGIQVIKSELEDTCMRYLDPIGYNLIEEKLNALISRADDNLEKLSKQIEKRLSEANLQYKLERRIKQIYSIYRKMFNNNKEFEEIYDIYAVRIIVDSVTECYAALGIIHDMFTPVPGRFKDYIGTPKPNMYQSLHTTVIGKGGVPFEVQIRTWEMHKTAEYGIAAHWKYKRGIFNRDSSDEKLMWIRQLLEIQSDTSEPEDFMRALKIDMFADEVFLFTPQGDVINLPAGSTVIDFAYSIHSAIGNRMQGAKVNGKIVELSYIPKNGEIVQILTASNATPNREWLKIAKTSSARNKIRQWFKKEKREENVEEGREAFEKELKRNNIVLTDEQLEELVSPIIKKNSFTSIDDFYAAISYGGISLTKIIPKIKDEYQRIVKQQEEQGLDSIELDDKAKETHTSGIFVEGISNCLVKLAQCCSPLPGDDIIGFVTRGFGVSVHKSDCKNIQNISEKERLIKVRWDTSINNDESFMATVIINAANRLGLAADITAQLAAMRVMIHGLNARECNDGSCVVTFTFEVKSLDHLQSVISRISKIKGVTSVSRGNM
ncbi:MAG: bifunctional (p)ppGpp synthetase/guanosine-3',5'-bis(diphosphate) 3'-pyrophosphohydrolase [Ruminococcaceae bacterium]|nr:bifunctional (p)ppGpp synthetase/guanosine-3',5'-bis(diphosphate) 3'-pyrophosphohydrolase [Oscillospiraceae bacterium]